MAVLNYGSLNIDMKFTVEQIVQPGQTIKSKAFKLSCGGKGFNQSIALAKAGATVYHAGKTGKNGQIFIDMLKENNVNVSGITTSNLSDGRAVVQVDGSGENSIILYGGSNLMITKEEINSVLVHFKKGDLLLLQNEINNIPYLIDKAKQIGMKVAVNLAPISADSFFYPLDLVDYLIINETEGATLTGLSNAADIVTHLVNRYRSCVTVLTLGINGVILSYNDKMYSQSAYMVDTVDTTGAGDTFVGYFIQSVQSGKTLEKAADLACKASALCVSLPGSSDSIPCRSDVERKNLLLRSEVENRKMF